MKYLTKIRKFKSGTSYVNIPKMIITSVNPGTSVYITLEKVENHPIEYKCKKCEHVFTLDSNEETYCTACGSEKGFDEIDNGI